MIDLTETFSDGEFYRVLFLNEEKTDELPYV